jgi:ketosteroid isomerase-like protein
MQFPRKLSILTNHPFMKILLFVCLFSLTQTIASSQTNSFAEDPAASTTTFFQSLLDKKSSELTRVITSDFGVVSFDGEIVDGYTLSQAVSEGYLVIEEASTSGLRTRSYGDAAIITGNWKTKGNVQGTRFDTEVVFTSMCVKQGGSWKVASMQFTPIR